MGTSQTLALDEFLARLTPEDVAAIRSRVGVARLDQHKAAERDALTVARLGVRGAREAWLPHAGVPEWLSPFPAVIAGQLLAGALAAALGHDPDHPRGLTKVTLTR